MGIMPSGLFGVPSGLVKAEKDHYVPKTHRNERQQPIRPTGRMAPLGGKYTTAGSPRAFGEQVLTMAVGVHTCNRRGFYAQ